MFPLKQLGGAVSGVLLLLSGGCHSAPQQSSVPRSFSLPDAFAQAEKRTLDLRTLEALQRTGSEFDSNRRLLELPAFAAEYRKLKTPPPLENDIRLRILEEAMDAVALQRLPGKRDPVEFYRPFVARRMRFELSRRWSEYSMLTHLSSLREKDREHLRDLRLELALSLGCAASELPELEGSSLPSPETRIRLRQLPEELRKIYGEKTEAPLLYAMMLFRLPAELQRRENSDEKFSHAHAVAAALYYGAAFRIVIAQEHLLRAENDLRQARAGRRRDWLSPEAADAELRAIHQWRTAFFRLQYDIHCAPKGRGTPAERRWVLDFAMLQQ